MAISIRRATIADIGWMMIQLREFSDHYGGKYPLFGDKYYVEEAMIKTITDHIVFVAECSRRGLVGFICGVLVDHLYNPRIKMLTELFWWVEPQSRRTRASKMLIDEYVHWGKQHANWLTFGLMANSPVKQKALEKRGFRLQETSYLLEV